MRPPFERTIVSKRGADTLEDAFVSCLQEAIGDSGQELEAPHANTEPRLGENAIFELRRDPIRGVLAILGSLILMVVIGLGINIAKFVVDLSRFSAALSARLSGLAFFVARLNLV
ncbi:hypothetical protein [Pacificibacter marinus]|uniref:hypothetical protein n=1 Tax=Pacificibacter marinus TaxID=658057 RepID=UPI000A267B43|nr:hypothetical protein [Pacificibacter marinus]